MKILGTWGLVLLFWFSRWSSAGAGGTVLSSAELAEKGSALFLQYCAHCHGLKGGGDGYNAEFLEKEPANLSDLEFMGKKKDGQIFRTIQKGGAGVHKSHLMPVFGYTLSEEEIWSLVAYVRTLSGSSIQQVSIPDSITHEKLKEVKVNPNDIKRFSAWLAKGEDPGLIEVGEKLFKKKKSCVACHKIEKALSEYDEDDAEDTDRYEGGHVGPDLTRSGFMFPPDWLYIWLKNPQGPRPKTKMPNLGFDDDDIKAVITYLISLRGEKKGLPEEWMPYLDVEGDPEEGKRLFYDPKSHANCVECHSINKKGGDVGPDLGFIGSARTRAFLLESILDPNKVITVGYSKVTLLFKKKYKGKRTLTGVLSNEDESSFEILDKDGQTHLISKDLVMKFFDKPSEMMQKKFDKKLSVKEVGDILAFLETLKWPTLEGINSSPMSKFQQ